MAVDCEQMNSASPFDSVAIDYDTTFTDTRLGREKRRAVHRFLEGIPVDGRRVLELNCGTGHDALFLALRGADVLATDISDRMIAIARAKARERAPSRSIAFRRLSLEDLADDEVRAELGRFDLVLSNFDGLNCLEDPSILCRALDDLLDRKGSAVLVYMPPVSMVEIIGNLARGRFRKAFARLRRNGTDVHIGRGVAMRTRFHTVSTIARALPPGLRLRTVRAIGLFLPPTSMRGIYGRAQGFLDAMERLSAPLHDLPPFNRMGDHVLLHIQRNGTQS